MTLYLGVGEETLTSELKKAAALNLDRIPVIKSGINWGLCQTLL